MRVLSAIIFADIEGFSALMQEDEKRAIEYRNKFKSKLEENLDKYEGKIIQFYGDGALLTFSSGLKAVEYALKVQQEFQAEPKVPARIGVHMAM
jgi:class 3 adenylate cyclase